METERIYIGGLDPPRLTADDVCGRLRALSGVEILSTSAVADMSFFYVTARRLKSDENELSALKIISKHYHNVKWKGCKLIVEKAKPHFLERLAIERDERTRQQELKDTAAIQSPMDRSLQNVIPRHLRIRQRYGEEAFHVDLKPYRADDWSAFVKSISWMRKRRENYSNKQVVETKDADLNAKGFRQKPFLNRAVHLAFNEATCASLREEDDDRHSGSADEQDYTNSSESESSEDSDLVIGSEEVIHTQSGAYKWSDDESSSSDSDVDSKSDDSRAISAPSGSIIHNELREEKKEKSSKPYAWSSDEDSSDEEAYEVGARKRSAPSTTDEFASAIDIDGEGDSDSEHKSIDTPFDKTESKSRSIKEDISSNLGILSEIFPDMSSVPTAFAKNDSLSDVQDTTDDEADEADEGPTDGPSRPGWETPSLMQRYDPTKESAKKFVVQPEKTEEYADDGSQSKASDTLSDEPSAEPEVPSQNSEVYEQQKLEKIFQQSRTGEGTSGFQLFPSDPVDTPNQPEQTTETTSAAGSFSFSFDLKTGVDSRPETKYETANGRKTLLFHGEMEDERRHTDPHQQGYEGNLIGEGNLDVPTNKETDRFRRRGLLIPQNVLDDYQDAFFSLNEGNRILEDLEGFRNDKELHAQWMAKRQQLTQDWKRKRKYAQSRMQKKAKHR